MNKVIIGKGTTVRDILKSGYKHVREEGGNSAQGERKCKSERSVSSEPALEMSAKRCCWRGAGTCGNSEVDDCDLAGEKEI